MRSALKVAHDGSDRKRRLSNMDVFDDETALIDMGQSCCRPIE